MKNCKPFLFIVAFICLSHMLTAQVENGSFELWPDSLEQGNFVEDFIESGIEAIPSLWIDGSDHGNGPLGFYRTTDAVDGEYATVIYTWYVYVKTTLAKSDTITERPDFLAGYYKYLQKDPYTEPKDSAIVSILVFNALGDTIGIGHEYLDSVSTYTSFYIPIEYKNNDAGFSYYLSFTSSVNTCHSFVGQCNYLFLDGVTFDYFTHTNEDLEGTDMAAYPNPSNGDVYFSSPFTTCDIYNFQGQLIKTISNNNRILLPDLSGIYVLNINDLDGNNSIHKVIKN